MKYKELYRYGVDRLLQAGIEEASLDARLLLEFVCHTDRNTLLAHGDMEVMDEQHESYVNYISRREKHIPLQHLTGSQEFMGLTFLVNEHVLIPRQDTEILVEAAMKELHDGMSVLDMCTGSGCILLSLLHYSNNCKGVGVDISPKALEVARENAVRISGTAEEAAGSFLGEKDLHIEFIQSDLFAGLEQGQKFDMLVSNPPYIRSDVIPTLMEEVKIYEPMGALDGMEDGLYFYREISRNAKAYLYRGAVLFFEIGYDQAEAVSHILREDGYKEIEVIKDFAGLDRVVKCIFQE